MCALICMPKAITLRPGVSGAALPTRVEVRQGMLRRCTRCGAAFALDEAQTLCPVCRDREERLLKFSR